MANTKRYKELLLSVISIAFPVAYQNLLTITSSMTDTIMIDTYIAIIRNLREDSDYTQEYVANQVMQIV